VLLRAPGTVATAEFSWPSTASTSAHCSMRSRRRSQPSKGRRRLAAHSPTLGPVLNGPSCRTHAQIATRRWRPNGDIGSWHRAPGQAVFTAVCGVESGTRNACGAEFSSPIQRLTGAEGGRSGGRTFNVGCKNERATPREIVALQSADMVQEQLRSCCRQRWRSVSRSAGPRCSGANAWRCPTH